MAAQTLAGYVSIYLKEEVQQEGLVRNIGDFAMFLEAAAFSHASPLNISEIARECEVNRKTVEGYIDILERGSFAWLSSAGFARRVKRRLIKHAKFYFFDSGVFPFFTTHGAAGPCGRSRGPALEGLVAQHLRAWIDYRGQRDRLYFWRAETGLEVDFVVCGPDTFTAIEVKNSRRVYSKDTRSLREFISDYPEATPCLLYRGDERIQTAGITCIPCEEFLARVHPGRHLPIQD